MKFEQLKAHIKQDAIKPCYLVSGEDAYLVDAAVSQLCALAGEWKDFNVAVYRGSYTASVLHEALYTLPLFGGRRVVVAHDCTCDLAALEAFFASPVPDTVLVFAGGITPNFTAALKKGRIEVIDCARLNESMLIRWIAASASRLGGTVTRMAAETLIKAANGFLTRISMELGKLIDYAGGREITVKDVEELVSFDLEYKIYELGDALIARDGKKAASILGTLSKSGSAVPTLGYLYRHFRRLLFYKLNAESDTLSSDLGVSEYAVRMGLKSVRGVSAVRLKKLTDELHGADFGFKTGRIKDETALAAFVGCALA